MLPLLIPGLWLKKGPVLLAISMTLVLFGLAAINTPRHSGERSPAPAGSQSADSVTWSPNEPSIAVANRRTTTDQARKESGQSDTTDLFARLRTAETQGPAALGQLAVRIQQESDARLLAHVLNLLAALPANDPLRRRWDGPVLSRLSEIAPQIAAEHILHVLVHAAPKKAGEAIKVLMRSWALSDPARAATWTEGLPRTLKARAMNELIATVPSDQLSLLDAQAEAWPAGSDRTDLRMRLAMRRAQQDPAAAAIWADSLADSGERGAVLHTLLDEWAGKQPSKAAEFVKQLLEDRREPDAYFADNLIAEWNRRNPQDALTWVGGLPDGALKDRALTLLATSADETSLFDMATHALQNGADTDNSELVSTVGQRLLEIDPAYAADWALQLPDPQARNAALGETLAGWARNDPDAAAGFVDALAPGPLRDYAAVAIQTGSTSSDDESDGAAQP